VNSLSSRYGTGAFPSHTDFAALETPPRYVALACPFERSAPTYLYDTQASQLGFTLEEEGALFRVCRGRILYTSRLVARTQSSRVVRFNRDCMTPLNKSAEEVSERIYGWHPTQTIDWTSVIWVLFDNWRLLHGRGPSRNENRGWLWRIAIWDVEP
jgi:L-asparagine oxygenase